MPPSHSVAVLAYQGLCTFEFGIVVEVFGLPRPELGVPWYRFRACSLERGPVRATGGLIVQTRSGLRGLAGADTIVIPGWRDPDEPPPGELLRAVRRAHERGARLVSICSGVFVLAAAGVLDGRRATTHWRLADRLAARYPHIRVERDVLYVDEGDVLTSAGSAAGIDACLHIVRSDYGAAIANQVARRLVMPPHREGGQAQYVAEPVSIRDGQTSRLAGLLDRVQAGLNRRWTIPDLAKQVGIPPRSFARRFRSETGTTPHRWLTHVRLLAAERLLETTAHSIDQIAGAVGFRSAETLRHHFRTQIRTTPVAYRRRFAG